MTVNKKRLEILSKIGSTDMQELVAYLTEHNKLVTDLEHDIDQYREIDKQNLKRIAELEKKIEYLCLDQENYEPILVAENQRLKAKLDIVFEFIDRMNDPTPDDPLEKSAGEFVGKFIEALQQERRSE